MSERASRRLAGPEDVEAIYRTAPIGLCIIDRDLRFVRINERLAGMNGRLPAEHIGRSVRDMVPEVADRLEPILIRVMETGAPRVDFELHGQTSARPGVQRTWIENYVPLFDAAGEVLGLNIGVEEVSGLRRREKERARRAHRRSLALHSLKLREEERARMARELHDELGQSLTAVKIGLEWVASQAPATPPVFRDRLHDLDRLLGTTMGFVRRFSERLRPVALDLVGLGAAVEELAAEFQAATGIACALATPFDEPALPPLAATALFRIVQEALTNIARHARATRIEIDLRAEARQVILTIHDDGRGIPGSALADPKALGIAGMRERAHGVGGTIVIAGRPAEGTMITVMVPCVGSGRKRPAVS